MRITETGNKKLRVILVVVLGLTWVALTLIMTALIFWSPDWHDATLDREPTLYWPLFVIVIGGSVFALVATAVRPLFFAYAKEVPPGKTKPSIASFIGSLALIGTNLVGPDWTGGRLFLLTIGWVLLLMFAGDMILAYRKRQRTA